MGDLKVLRAPVLPQMENDGVIDANDLEVGYIYVVVPPYSNMVKGDGVNIYFGRLDNKFRVVDDDNINQPIVVQFDASKIPDGVYDVYYSSTDIAGNMGTSTFATAIVNRDGLAILPAPEFTDAVNGYITSSSVIANQGTHVHVPLYQGIRQGDVVDVYYNLFNDSGEIIADATYSESHLVTSAETATGFSVLVPASKLFLPDGKSASARYRVTRALTGEVDRSQATTVLLSGAVSFLPQPWFPDAVQGWLTYQQLEQGVRVRVPSYSSITAGDRVILYWQGFDNNNYPISAAKGNAEQQVTATVIAAGYLEFILPRAVAVAINQGRLDAYYCVVNSDQNWRISYTASANIDITHYGELTPPVFTQASNGVLAAQQVASDGAVKLSISYSSMAVDDSVTLVISGENSDGVLVSAADYQQVLRVTANDVASGSLIIVAPASLVSAVGDKGSLHAYYFVIHANGGLSSSSDASVMITDSSVPATGITLKTMTGAPPFDYNSVHVRPYNMVFVQAPAGTTITASCTSPATFKESSTINYTFTVDATGKASFSVSSPQAGLITLVLQNQLNPSEIVYGAMTFNPYVVGNGRIKAIASSSGAIADGISPCSIYLVTESESDRLDAATRRPITYIRAAVNGSAKILGYASQQTDVLLNSDNSVQIDFTDTVSEIVTATLTLPESSGSTQNVNLYFTSQE